MPVPDGRAPEVAIIPTLLSVGPPRPDPADQTFALTLATSYVGKGPKALPPAELLPWTNGFGNLFGGRLINAVAVACRDAATDDEDPREGEAPARSRDDSLRDPALADGRLQAVQAWITETETDFYFDPNAATVPAARGVSSGHHLGPDLGHLASAPGNIPVVLWLVYYFKLPSRIVEFIKGANADRFELLAAPMTVDGDGKALVGPASKFRFWRAVALPQAPGGAAAAAAPARSAPAWTQGWPYGTSTRTMKAYVKPLEIRRAADGVFQYGLVAPAAAAPAAGEPGPDLSDYWFRIRDAAPWTNGIEARFQTATSALGNIMSYLPEIASLKLDDDAEANARLRAGLVRDWRTLVLMSLGFFSRWTAETPADPPSDPALSPPSVDAILRSARFQLSDEERECLIAGLKTLERRLRPTQAAEAWLAWETWVGILLAIVGRDVAGGDRDRLTGAMLTATRLHGTTDDDRRGTLAEIRAALQTAPAPGAAPLPEDWVAVLRAVARSQAAEDGRSRLAETIADIFYDDARSERPSLIPRLLFGQFDYVFRELLDRRSDAGLIERWQRRLDAEAGDIRKVGGKADAPLHRTFGLPPFEFGPFGPMRVHQETAHALADGRLGVDTVTDPSGLPGLVEAWLTRDQPGTAFRPWLARVLPGLLSPSEVDAVLSRAQWARNVRDRLVAPLFAHLPGGVDSGKVLKAPKPVGLTTQCGTVAADATAVPMDDADRLRYAGLFYLIRREGQKSWHVATAARVVLPDGSDLLQGPALVPLRLPYRNGVRYPFLNYNQRPMVAPSPLGRAVAADTTPIHPQGLALDRPRYSYRAVIGRADPNADQPNLRPVRLKYGGRYQVAVGMIDAAGGVPTALAADDRPWSFDPRKLAQGDLYPPAREDKVVTLAYLREVRVGQVRVSSLDGRERPISWPELPAGVAPLAREIPGDAASGDGRASNDPRPPLLLLRSEGASAVFGVKLPTVDMDVLERWIPEGNAKERQHLENVWVEYLTRVDARRHDPDPGRDPVAEDPAHDISLDDPAVTLVRFRLEEWDWDHARWVVRASEAEVRTPPPDVANPQVAGPVRSDMGAHQRDWIRVRCDRRDQADWVLSFDGQNTVSVGVPSKIASPPRDISEWRGRVARLSIYGVVEPDAARRFPDRFFDREDDGGPDPGSLADPRETDHPAQWRRDVERGSRILRPYRILLETPTDLLPGPADVWRGLTIDRLPRPDGSLALRLDAPVGAAADADHAAALRALFRNIGTCEILKQTWRWQGRPVAEPPFPTSSRHMGDELDASPAVLRWEAGEFAGFDERLDSLSIPMSYALPTGGAGAEPLFVDTATIQQQAQYIRYGIVVRSRYEGIYPALQPVTGQQRADLLVITTGEEKVQKDVPLNAPGWRRAFLCYRGQKPDPPVISSIVPTTEPVVESVRSWLLEPAEVNDPRALLKDLFTDPNRLGTHLSGLVDSDPMLKAWRDAILASSAHWTDGRLALELAGILNAVTTSTTGTQFYHREAWTLQQVRTDPELVRLLNSRAFYDSPEGLAEIKRRLLQVGFPDPQRGNQGRLRSIRRDRAAAVRLVISQPACSSCGLTETIECQLVRTTAPYTPPGSSTNFPTIRS